MEYEIYACLKSSPLWRFVHQLSLNKNMRAHLYNSLAEEFFHQLLQIGNDALPLSNTLQQHVLQCGHMVSTLAELKEKNKSVDKVNHELPHILPGDASTFVSIDTIIDKHAAFQCSVEFLNSLQPTGLPPHKSFLKKGGPIMLLRNLDPPRLCNGTRLTVTTMTSHVQGATIIAGCHRGEIAHIPHMLFMPLSVPFQFKHLQFSVRLSFAMTVNKAHGQTFKKLWVSIYKYPTFLMDN
uniref:DNA helicase Pif1-like 2B domain-containing protein n=1 Tax=Octopus bimaculoides TaxID=37653 RepID=A0A0L8H8X7_OCTBM